jgi:hypothetical protein
MYTTIKMRECSDCRENDRCFSMNLHYRCENTYCENYVVIQQVCCEILTDEVIFIKEKPKPKKLKQLSIRQFLIWGTI